MREHVVAILDHHKDEGLAEDAKLRVVEVVGSAATIVGAVCLDDRNSFATDRWVARLLLGPIAVDTIG